MVAEGYNQNDVIDEVKTELKNYINGLNISGDVVRAKIYQTIMNVEGVINVDLISPAADVILLDDQLARTNEGNMQVL